MAANSSTSLPLPAPPANGAGVDEAAGCNEPLVGVGVIDEPLTDSPNPAEAEGGAYCSVLVTVSCDVDVYSAAGTDDEGDCELA